MLWDSVDVLKLQIKKTRRVAEIAIQPYLEVLWFY
jgi:hypothetical protein